MKDSPKKPKQTREKSTQAKKQSSARPSPTLRIPTGSRTTAKISSLPTIIFDTGWVLKCSKIPNEQTCLFFYSQYTGQVIMRFFSKQNNDKVTEYVGTIVSKSARKIYQVTDSYDEADDDKD